MQAADNIAKRLYQRAQHNRDAITASKAKNIEAAIYETLLTNERDAFDVADDIPTNLTTGTAILLIRAAVIGNREAVLQIVLNELSEAVKRVADYRAIAEVEAMKEEDFLPG